MINKRSWGSNESSYFVFLFWDKLFKSNFVRLVRNDAEPDAVTPQLRKVPSCDESNRFATRVLRKSQRKVFVKNLGL